MLIVLLITFIWYVPSLISTKILYLSRFVFAMLFLNRASNISEAFSISIFVDTSSLFQKISRSEGNHTIQFENSLSL